MQSRHTVTHGPCATRFTVQRFSSRFAAPGGGKQAAQKNPAVQGSKHFCLERKDLYISRGEEGRKGEEGGGYMDELDKITREEEEEEEENGRDRPAWEEMDEDHAFRELALAVAMAWHRRLGQQSSLSTLDDHILRTIMGSVLEAPVVVPDDYPTLLKAVESTIDGQTILVRKGRHVLNPRGKQNLVISKRVKIVGEPGAVLEGGLHMSFGSDGVLKNLQIIGHVWVYGGKWDMIDCVFRSRLDTCVLASNESRLRAWRCVVGGIQERQHAVCGFIIYGRAVAAITDLQCAPAFLRHPGLPECLLDTSSW
eukprot:765320-Hanusia_phi.AAC.1